MYQAPSQLLEETQQWTQPQSLGYTQTIYKQITSRDAKSYEENKTVREQKVVGPGWHIGSHKRAGNHADISGENLPGRRQKPGWCGKAASRRSIRLEPSEWREEWLEDSRQINSFSVEWGDEQSRETRQEAAVEQRCTGGSDQNISSRGASRSTRFGT